MSLIHCLLGWLVIGFMCVWRLCKFSLKLGILFPHALPLLLQGYRFQCSPSSSPKWQMNSSSPTKQNEIEWQVWTMVHVNELLVWVCVHSSVLWIFLHFGCCHGIGLVHHGMLALSRLYLTFIILTSDGVELLSQRIWPIAFVNPPLRYSLVCCPSSLSFIAIPRLFWMRIE